MVDVRVRVSVSHIKEWRVRVLELDDDVVNSL